MIFRYLGAALFLFSCSSQPVMVHSTKLEKPAKISKMSPPKKTLEAAPKPAPAPEPPPAPVAPAAAPPPPTPAPAPVEVKIVPKVQTPEILVKNINNNREATKLIENTLTLDELEASAADPTMEAFKPQLLLKIGKVYQKNKEPDRAGEYYRSLTTLYPQSVYSTQASILLASLQSSSEADANVIGAILPLTGRNSSVGQHALNAIRLGLELNKNDKKFRVALYDSQSDPELAAKGVDKLATEDKVVAILGGFTSKEAVAIAARAELLSVPFVGFSQKHDLTGIGEYVFQNAVTPDMQVDKLVSFAFEKLSAKRFAILFPNDSYGVEFSNVFWDHVLARGGQITAAQSYDPATKDFSDVVQKMIGQYYEEPRAEELRQKLKDMKTAARKKEKDKDPKDKKPAPIKNLRDSYSEANLLPPVVDFDVLFVPDSSRALGQVLAFMKFNDVTDMNYMGTNLWNTADLPKRAANEDAGIYFVDAVDVNDLEVRQSDFFKEYFTTYNEEPTLVEVQSYEAAKIVREQVEGGAKGREALAAALRGLGKSNGVTGPLLMSPQRELLRSVHVMTLDSGVVKRLE